MRIPEVVEGPCEEGGEGGGEGDGSVPAGHANANTEHVLLADEALDKPAGINLGQKKIREILLSNYIKVCD